MESSEAVTLREYFEALLKEQERARISAVEQMEHRLAGMNEFRAALEKQSSTFATRIEHDRLATDIKALQLSEAKLAGMASQKSVVVAQIMAAAGFLVSIIVPIIEALRK